MWLQLVYRCVPSLNDGEAAAAFLDYSRPAQAFSAGGDGGREAPERPLAISNRQKIVGTGGRGRGDLPHLPGI
jgi:hypothetical protein